MLTSWMICKKWLEVLRKSRNNTYIGYSSIKVVKNKFYIPALLLLLLLYQQILEGRKKKWSLCVKMYECTHTATGLSFLKNHFYVTAKVLTVHTVNSGSEMTKALNISKFWIYCVNMLDKNVATWKKNFLHCPFL